MTPEVIGILALGLFVALLFFGVHVGLAGMAASITGVWMISGPNSALNMIGVSPFSEITEFVFAVVPLFILMGSVTDFSGALREVYGAAQIWLGRLPGGLAVAALASCTGFAAACGSSLATVTAIGKMTLPEMKRAGYHHRLSAGALAAGGGIGIMIPPSIPLVLYGMLTGTSVGKLLIAGFVPGIIEFVLYSLTVIILVKLKPRLAPGYQAATTWRQKIVSLREIWPVLLLVFAVLGSMYSGIATPTEAAAFGAVGIFVVTILKRRLNRSIFKRSLTDTMMTTASIFFLIIGALIFTRLIALSRIAVVISESLANSGISPILIFSGVMVLYIVLGLFMDGFSMMVVTLPTIFPLMLSLGYDPIWFGIIMIILIEIGGITPPFAINLFAIRAVAPEISWQDMAVGIVPFFVASLVAIVLFTAFPGIVMFLPNTMR